MKLSEIMSHAGLSRYAEVALILFLAAFVAVAWWTFRPGAKSRMEYDARLPLDDDGAPRPRTGGDA
jgi:cbb3-type cytochrome oxidase subunit 3